MLFNIISMQGYILMLTPIDLDVHHLTIIFAFSDWFIKNESRFLIYFTIILFVLIRVKYFTLLVNSID